MSAPSENGCWNTGVAKVLSTTTSAPLACAMSAIASMSDTIRRGLVGVSSQTSRVRSVIAAAHGVEIGGIDRRDREIEAREDAIQQPERAAVDVERHDDLVVRPQVGVQHRVFGGEA